MKASIVMFSLVLAAGSAAFAGPGASSLGDENPNVPQDYLQNYCNDELTEKCVQSYNDYIHGEPAQKVDKDDSGGIAPDELTIPRGRGRGGA